MLQGLLFLVFEYLFWVTFFGYGIYFGSIWAEHAIEVAFKIGRKFFLFASATFIIRLLLDLFSEGLNTFLETSVTVGSLFMSLVQAVIFFASAVIPGFLFGYYIAKDLNKPKA